MSGNNKYLTILFIIFFYLIIGQNIRAARNDTLSSPALAGKKLAIEKALPTPSPHPSKIVVAIIDNYYFTREMLERKIAQFLLPIKGRKLDEEYYRQKRFYEGKMAEEWISIALLAAEAEKQGIKVSDQEVEQKIQELYSQYSADIDLTAALLRLGTTPEEFRKEIHQALLGEKLIRIYLKSKYDQKERREFFERNRLEFFQPETVRVSQVFRPITDMNDREKKKIKKEMERIRKKLLKGTSIEEVIQKEKADPSIKGSDLGWLTRENLLRPPLNKEIFNIEPEKISEIYETDIGYHIIKVHERKPARLLNFDEAQERLEELLFDQAKEDLIKELRPKHTVIINLGGIKDTIVRKHLPDFKPD